MKKERGERERKLQSFHALTLVHQQLDIKKQRNKILNVYVSKKQISMRKTMEKTV